MSIIESLESKMLDLANDLTSIRCNIKKYKSLLSEEETKLISCKLQLESTIEDLRKLKNSLVYNQPSESDLDIERFKIAHLEIIKKI